MKFTGRFLIGLVLLQGIGYAQTPTASPQPTSQPEIQVVDGKVSMAVQSMPLSRVLSLLDRAMGMTSTVKPELANRNISVRFSNLELKDAVHKIFEGQPFNYMLVQGKGIRVIDLAQGGSTTSTASSSSFQDSPISQPPPTVTPLQPVQPANTQPINAQPATAQPANPAAAQPAANPFGGAAPAANPASTNPAATPATPGQLPPPVGGANPLTSPAGAPQVPVGGFPVTPPPPPQPAGPGTLGGAAPGTVPTR